MTRQDRIEIQKKGDEEIRKGRGNMKWILKQDSLNVRARKIGIATDMPSINREMRRRDLKSAVRMELKAIKKRASA